MTDIDVKETFRGLSSKREEGEGIKWGSRREASASVFTLRSWREGSRGENCQHCREEIRPELYLQMQGFWGHMVGGEGQVASIQSQSREPEQHGAQRAHTAFKALPVTGAVVWGL